MYNDARRKVRTHTQMHDRRQWQSPSNGAASVASRCWDNPSPKKARARCGSAGLADGDDHCVLHEIKHDLGEANGPTVNSEINDYLLEALHCLILNIVLHVAATEVHPKIVHNVEKSFRILSPCDISRDSRVIANSFV